MGVDLEEAEYWRRYIEEAYDTDFNDPVDDIPWKDEDSESKMSEPLMKKVTIFQDHNLQYPDLWLAVHVITDRREEEAQFADWLTRAKCFKADSLEDADLVVFTGGSDVSPELYNAKKHNKTYSDRDRDDREIDLYLKCLEEGIPMLGICRGMQFLHVMNGGKLYQDVDNHYKRHDIWDVVDKQNIYNCSSVHHQMCADNTKNGMKLIATAKESRNRWYDNETVVKGHTPDVEAFYYRDTCCLGIQGHPEYRGYNGFSVWALKKIEQWIVSSPDVGYLSGGKRLRVKPELLYERFAVNKKERPEDIVVKNAAKEDA